MRILLNCLTIAPGGGLTVLLRLIRALARNGYHCHVLAGVPASIESIQSRVSELENVTLHPHLIHLGSAVKFLLAGPVANRLAIRESCDLAIGINYYYPLRIPQITFHLNLLHFVPRDEGNGILGFGSWVRDHQAAKALRKSCMNVFESRYLLEKAKERCEEISGSRVIYSPNILDDVGSVSGGSRSNVKIVAVTSDQPHKDNVSLIRMLYQLHLNGATDMKLLIIGGGLASFAVERKLAEELGLGKSVEFLGRLGRADLASQLANAFCLVSTSQVESFCMVATEAMSVGCPVVVSNCAAMPESVGGYGLLAKPGDASAFARQVLSLRSDEVLYRRLCEQGKEYVQAFSEKRYHAALEDLMQDMAGRLSH